jgi:hypothetical protein
LLAQNFLNIRQLHGRDPKALAHHLVAQSDRDRLEELAQQIVWLAQVVWTKNTWLQRSLLAAAAAPLFWSLRTLPDLRPGVIARAGFHLSGGRIRHCVGCALIIHLIIQTILL